MKIDLGILGLFVLGLGGVTGRSLLASHTPYMMKDDKVTVAMRNENERLEVSLVAEKLVYKSDDQVTLRAMLLNSSTDPIYVYGILGWGYSSSFTIHVTDQNARDIQPESFDDSITPPVPSNDKSVFVKLFSQHFLGAQYHSTIHELNMKKPGKYTLFVEYHCPIRAASVDLSPFWGREKGTIRSNLVRVEVLQ